MTKEATIRTGRKPTMGERLTQKGRLPEKYLLPLDNHQVRADIQSRPIEGGEEVTFTLAPDTADVFRSELGLAYRPGAVDWIRSLCQLSWSPSGQSLWLLGKAHGRPLL